MQPPGCTKQLFEVPIATPFSRARRLPGLPPGATQEQAQQALTKWALTRKHPPLVVPETYANPETTKLRQKVPPEGPVRLELRGKG